VGEEALGVLGVERPAREAAAGREAHDHRHRRADAVVLLGGDGDQLVERARDEVGELHLAHGPHAHERGAGARADDGRLGQGRVDHPVLAELLQEALGDLERAAVDADVLADQKHARVAPHLLAERV